MNSNGLETTPVKFADDGSRPRFWLVVIIGILALGLAVARGADVAEVYGLTGTYSTTLIQGIDGNFYGTTPVGGPYNLGTVFEWDTHRIFSTLATFDGTNGNTPNGLVQTADGSLYGTANLGGQVYPVFPYGNGTAFKIDPSGNFSLLFAFPDGVTGNPASAIRPFSPLIVGGDGNLYGLSQSSAGAGAFAETIYRIVPGSAPSTLAPFNNAYPDSALTLATNGVFYCAASHGAPGTYGNLIQMPAGGPPYHISTFYTFTDPLKGAYPVGGLLPAAGGSLYGVTTSGGADGQGTIYNVTTNGVLTNLVSFNWANGAGPQGGLVFGSDGSLYGTTAVGGSDGVGTVFMLSTNNTFTTLGSFNGTDGAYPASTLIPGSDGNLYGVTPAGGTNGTGVIFQVAPGGAPTAIASLPGFNGAAGWGDLITGADGNFYGTTFAGGTYEYGTVFRLTTNGAVNLLYSFGAIEDTNGLSFDGGGPQGELIQAADGSFYGTTSRGGTNDAGTIYHLTANGTLATLFSFNGANGSNPQAGLTIGADGSFYGTTSGGGTYGNGTVFKFATNGGLTTLFSFTNSPISSVLYSNGFRPFAGLTRGGDGNLYGVTASTAFQITPEGNLATLAVFTGPNGATPVAALTPGLDGNLYGSTAGGGADNSGTVFRLAISGTLTTLLSFQRTNGSTPCGRLIRALDGNFYGTTRGGAVSNCGTVFRITTNGALTTLATFNYTNGANPVGGLTLGSDGNLYGMTVMGGSGTRGNLFEVALPPTLRVTTGPGAVITLTWNTVPGQSYQVQTSTTLTPSAWTNYGPPLTATTGVLTALDTLGTGQQFYRIVLFP